MDNPFLVEVTRGHLVESRHRGSVSVVDAADVQAGWQVSRVLADRQPDLNSLPEHHSLAG